MSNPIHAFRIEESESPSSKSTTQSLSMSSDSEQPTPLEISATATAKSQSTTSPTSNESPSTVSRLKSFFKKRRHSTPTQVSISIEEPPTEVSVCYSEKTPPSSPTHKLHVTFKDESKHRIQSSPIPLSNLNDSPILEEYFQSNNENSQANKETTHHHHKHRHSHPQQQQKNSAPSSLPEESVLRNPTNNDKSNDFANNEHSPSYLHSILKKTEEPTAVLVESSSSQSGSSPSDHQSINNNNIGALDNNNQDITLNCTTNPGSTIAMAMDKVEPVSSGFGVALADTENFVNTKQGMTSSPLAIKKGGSKQKLDNVIEDFLTKSASSPAQDEITPNRNLIVEEVAEESSDEDYSEEDDRDHSDEESNEEEGSSESEDIEETKPNTSLNETTEIKLADIEDPMSVKTMISPKDLQTISYEVNEKLNESVQKEFNLSKEEQVLDSFLCAYYESKMPQQGKMYITQNFVCFSSNIFGYKICLVIAFSDVKSIEKKMTAMFIPNAIEIFLKDDTSHFFGSFVFRDNVYKVLLALYSLHAKARGNIMISLNSSSNVLQANDPKMKPPTLSDSSYATEEDEDEEEDEEDEDEEYESEEEEESETQPIKINSVTNISVATMGKSTDSNQNQTRANGEASKSKANNTNEDHKNNGQSNGNGNNEEKKTNDNPENNGNNGNNSNNNHNNNPNNNHNNNLNNGNGEEQEEDDDEDEYQLPEEDEKITGINDLPAGEFFADPDKFKPKEIASEVLPISMYDAWYLLKSDNTNFQLDHHKSREESNVQYSSYVKLAGSPGLMRKVAFVAKVNNSLGPKSTRIECVERAILCKGRKRIINQTSSTSLDVPFSDTFKIQNYWIFEDIDGKSCTLKIFSGVNFLKSSLLRWKIEDAGDKESKQALTMWIAQAKDVVTNAKSAGNLQSLKKGKPRKKKTSSKDSKKRSKRKSTEAKPAAAVTFEENPFAPSASPAAEVELDLLTKTLNFVFGIPGYLATNISLPVWLLLIIIISLLFLLFSQQYTIIQTMKQVEYNVQTYKQQTILFEQELNHLVFNLANINTTALTENSQQLQGQIADWLTARNELYKTHIDNDLLHSLLYELSEIKKIMYKKGEG